MYVSTYVMPQFARPATMKMPMTTRSLVPVLPWLASLNAVFARIGGASAAAVAARREKPERNVRSR
jgi:uncharacterized membrane protein